MERQPSSAEEFAERPSVPRFWPDDQEMKSSKSSGDSHGSSLQDADIREIKTLFAAFLHSAVFYLAEEGYRGFNIVRYRGKYYCLSQDLGPVDLPRADEQILTSYQKRGLCLIAGTLEEARHRIDQSPYRPFPELAEDGYRGFNLVHYKKTFYALSLQLGPVDLSQIEEKVLRTYQESHSCFIGKSLGEVKEAVDHFVREGTSPTESREKFDPYDLEGFLRRAIKHQVRGEYPQAMEWLKRALEMSPHHLGTWILIGTIGLEMEEENLIREALEQVRSISPHHPALPLLGDGLMRLPSRPPRNDISSVRPTKSRPKALFVCNLSTEEAHPLWETLQDYEITLLMLDGMSGPWPAYPRLQKGETPFLPAEGFPREPFDWLIIPYKHRLFWNQRNLVELLGSFAPRLMVPFLNGKVGFYAGESLHRLKYNISYLQNFFRLAPDLKGKRVLEVGCSDGMVCDLLTHEEPKEVIGVDIQGSVGCNYSDPKIRYQRMNASHLALKDQNVDVCFTIATLEHCPEPQAVLQEMKRVLKKKGVGYVQVGPLYRSPFGHHMFGYFDDFPWIHLRLSPGEILAYSRARGIDEKLKAEKGIDMKEYLEGMLNPTHINGKSIREYQLDRFVGNPEIETLHFSISYEGKDLLTAGTLKELSHIPSEDLVIHGFELVFRVRE